MIVRTFAALLTASLLCLSAGCNSSSKDPRPTDGEYEELSPLKNEKDPFAADTSDYFAA